MRTVNNMRNNPKVMVAVCQPNLLISNKTKRLTNAGIDFRVNIILGGAGSEKTHENAISNSKLLNEINSKLIFIATLHIDPGSPLDEKLKKGSEGAISILR